jgi:hypothetical protein
VIHARPVTHFHNAENDPPARVVKAGENEIALELDAFVPTEGMADQWGVVQLRFKNSEAMYDFFSGAGPVSQAIVRHNVEVANRPVNVVMRAFEGTFADERAKAEMIIRDLVDAGHLPPKALEDL